MNDSFDNKQFEDQYGTYPFSAPDKAENDMEEAIVAEPTVTEPTVTEPTVTEPTVTESTVTEPEEPTVIETAVTEPAEPETENEPEAEMEPEVLSPEPEKQDSTYAYSFRKATPVTPIQPTPSAEPKRPEMPKMPERKKNKKKASGTFKKFLLCACLAAVFGIISGGIFLGVNAIGNRLLGINKSGSPYMEIPKVDTVPPVEKGNTDESQPSGNLTVAEVAERCMPAMVAITNKSITEVPNFFGFGSQNYESTSSGSGIIVDQNENELLIATNNHVVSGATTLTVCFIDDTLVEAMIKGTDVENDLAVISVNLADIPKETISQIKVIQLGDSDELVVGDQVVAIGNALGYGQSVSSGWISALDREVVIDNITLNLIQTDAAINPGNSGGALLNMKGELIAINESKYADTTVEGMGYAIPISSATPILSELMSKTTRYKVDEDKASYLGVACKDISADFAEMYGVPTGVYVDSVEENGPAALAGIKKGDIITRFDGTKLTSYTELISLLEYYAAGEVIEVTICRADDGEYKEQTRMVTLGSRTDTDFLKGSVE